MSKKDEALKLALEGLEKWRFDKDPRGADEYITAIREALAEQPAQGCEFCSHPLYAGTKCKNCGREQPAQQQQDYWQEEARRYAQNAEFWRGKYEAAIAQQQEPVAWRVQRNDGEYELYFHKPNAERAAECYTKRPPVEPLYTSPQPQMQPCAGRNCGSTNPNLHSAECFEDYEKATGIRAWQGLTDERITAGARALCKQMAEQPAQQYNATSDHRLMEMPAHHEPVAWRFTGIAGLKRYMSQTQYDAQTPEIKKWYEPFKCANCITSPPASKPWVGLTEEEAEDIWNCYCDEMGEASINDAPDIARAIEVKLKEKNNG